jgi:hypothetical protein
MPLAPHSKGSPVGGGATRPSGEASIARRQAAAIDSVAALYREGSSIPAIKKATGEDPIVTAVALDLENARDVPRVSLVGWLEARAGG